jgi:hypothetical protein
MWDPVADEYKPYQPAQTNKELAVAGFGAMKHLICLTIFLSVTATISIARAGGQESRACEFEVKTRCQSGDARVTLAGGIVDRIEVNVFRCGLPGRPGYSCTIDSSRGDRDSK